MDDHGLQEHLKEMCGLYLITRPRRSSTSPNRNESLGEVENHVKNVRLNAVNQQATFRLSAFRGAGDSRGFLLGADGALCVNRRAGVEDPLGQVDEGVVPVADGQALCLE